MHRIGKYVTMHQPRTSDALISALALALCILTNRQPQLDTCRAQALVSLTTTGHVDIVDPSASVWEFFLGIAVIIFSTFIYTLCVANATSTLLRQDRLIEGYRGRLEQATATRTPPYESISHACARYGVLGA